jgi:serine/threonine-protein kinase
MMNKAPEKNSNENEAYEDSAENITKEPSQNHSDSKPDTYEATVAISREELEALGLRASLPEEPEEPESESGKYEATIAISREELEELGLKMSQPDPEPEVEIPDYEATIAISQTELAELGLRIDQAEPEPESEAEKDYQATVAISKSELAELGLRIDQPEAESHPAESESDNETPAPDADPAAEEETLNFDIETYAASELESEYYQNAVKKDHGTDKYRFQKRIVSGGMGSILKVLDQDLHRTLVMKVILPKFKGNNDTLEDFIAEAKITGLLEHPNIIPVHELGLTQDTGLFFTMKLAQGEALNDVLNEIRQGNPKYVEKYNTYHLLSIFRKVCDAVSFAHSKNIIHRDIKPHNIMVGEYGEVLLMDWGIAKFVSDPGKERGDPVLREIRKDILNLGKGKKDDVIKGSPTYMSPEQVACNPNRVDKKSDIFLLGATLYHIFTFEAPYFGKNIVEILHKAETGDLVHPQLRNQGRQIPDEVCRIILKAMEHRKQDRYPTVEDMAKDIDDLISGKWSRQEKKIFESGEMLMREGEDGEEAYLIVSGKVQVIKETGGHRIVLATLKEGDVIGEMSLITKEKVTRSASVEALETTEVAVLTKHVISQNLKKLPPYMEKIVSTLTDRLRIANTNIHPHAASDCTYLILKQLRMIFKDRSGGKARRLKVPYQELKKEISEDLGIAAQKVEKVLLRAIETNLVESRKEMLQIPDIDELARITEFARSQK